MARYELRERIGIGGMAEIFRGVAIAGGGFEKPVAIKRILPHLSQDHRFVELLIAEAKILSELRHRNIVQIYDVGIGDDGQYFLVMEFVDGQDLGELYQTLEKRRRRLPVDVAVHVCAEICEALDHAHHARAEDGSPLGLVHRDVSPSNVMLSRSGEVKLTDFGIAKRVEEVTGHGGVRGKFAYISPEQAYNAHVDARSDVFSVGVLLFELGTGERLFSKLTDFDALRAVRAAEIPRPSDLDPGIHPTLEAIILKAVARNPANRYPSARALGAELRGYRYSLDAAGGDPAIELAGLIDRHLVSETHEGGDEEHSVVRIDTAAGFTASGIRHLDRALSYMPEIPFDDDFETGAGFEEGDPSWAGTGTTPDLDVATEPSKALPPAAAIDDEATAVRRRPEAARARVRREMAEAVATSERSPPPVRAPTPTVRDVFHGAHAPAPAPPPAVTNYSYRRPVLQSQRNTRAVALIAVVAVFLGVVAFVLAGQLLDGGKSAAGAFDFADAGPPDAMPADAAAMAMPPDEIKPDGKRKRASKKRRSNAKKKRRARNRKARKKRRSRKRSKKDD